uniref:Uncharacterized protein n=1 Tax=Amazona collaria TaxID=241587 RepID=A0A8B9FWF6_9PSIT
MVTALASWLLALDLALGSAGQCRLEETGGGLRALGNSVLLSCRGYGFKFEEYSIQWYRQAPGGRPEWVSYIKYDSSVTEFGQSVESRASASRDNSRS